MKTYFYEAFDPETGEPFTGGVYAETLEDAREMALNECKDGGLNLSLVMTDPNW